MMRYPLAPPVNGRLVITTRTASLTPMVAIAKYGPFSRNVGRPINSEATAATHAPSSRQLARFIPEFSNSAVPVSSCPVLPLITKSSNTAVKGNQRQDQQRIGDRGLVAGRDHQDAERLRQRQNQRANCHAGK